MIGHINIVKDGLSIVGMNLRRNEIPTFIRLLEGYAKLLEEPKRIDWRTPARESLAACARSLWVRVGSDKAQALLDVATNSQDLRVLSDDEARSARRFLDAILDCEAA